LHTGANSILNYCLVRNADYPAYVKAVPLNGVPVLSNCTFADGSYYGLTIEKSTPTQLNNTFSNNYLGTIEIRVK
jgi:parallel beta-helix repeat protein